MKIHLTTFLILISLYCFAQKGPILTSFFGDTKKINLIIKETEAYGPAGDDSSSYEVELEKTGDATYKYSIKKINKRVLMFKEDFIYKNPVTFKVDNNRAIVIQNFKELQNSLHKNLVEQFGKDTASFGEYFFMMYHPKMYLDSYYTKFYEIIANYTNASQKELTKVVMIPSMGDSVPADFTRKVKQQNNDVEITTLTKVDTAKVKSYQYQKLIKKNGKEVEEYMKEKDMVATPTQITVVATAVAQPKQNIYLMNKIVHEHRQNYSRGQSPDYVIRFEINKVAGK